jgi:hypothetical protein
MKIERRTILLLLLVLSAVGKGAMARTVRTVREKCFKFSLVVQSLLSRMFVVWPQDDGFVGDVAQHSPRRASENRSLRANVNGNFFGLFSKKSCRSTADGVFETVRTPRWTVFWRSLLGVKDPSNDKSGACNDMCQDLCPVACYKSFKVEGTKCTCEALKCSGNAFCNSKGACQCKSGFNGNGIICCDTASGLSFVDKVGCAGLAAPAGTTKAPVTPTKAPVAPTKAPLAPTKAPLAPTKAPVSPPTKAPVRPTAAPRTRVFGRDVVAPELIDFVALSPSVVNVSAGNASINYQITLQDDKSGVASIRLSSDASFWRVSSELIFEPPVVGKPLTVNMSLPITKRVPQGSYFLYLQLQDNASNTDFIYPERLAKMHYPYDIEVINSNTDRVPPTLLGLTPLSPLTVTAPPAFNFSAFPIFFPPVTVQFQLLAQDDFSGIAYADMYPETNFSFYGWFSSFSSIDNTNRGEGVPTVINVTVYLFENVPRGPVPMRVELGDLAGKQSTYSAANLTGSGYQNIITVN